MTLGDIFDERSIKLDLEATTKDAVFTELVEAISAAHPECDKAEILAALHDRENRMSTGIASGIAIPHGYCHSINTVIGAVGVSQNGIDYDALDNKPVHVVFMLIMGEAAKENNLRILNQVFTLIKSEAFAVVQAAKDTREIHSILSRFR